MSNLGIGKTTNFQKKINSDIWWVLQIYFREQKSEIVGNINYGMSMQ